MAEYESDDRPWTLKESIQKRGQKLQGDVERYKAALKALDDLPGLTELLDIIAEMRSGR